MKDKMVSFGHFIIVLLLLITVIFPIKAFAAPGWVKEDGCWYYINDSGGKTTGWLKSGNWYYLNSAGSMAMGWKQVDGKWYFLNKTGAMQTGWQQLDGQQ